MSTVVHHVPDLAAAGAVRALSGFPTVSEVADGLGFAVRWLEAMPADVPRWAIDGGCHARSRKFAVVAARRLKG
ncbi:hypothetical protein [Lentzea sp. NPDC059081]|uniref:hypothetical protein n=1 Tax=Lentzea sp. NPDC059081 TaxID=3346719 RepID=UPI00369C3E3C